MHGAEAAVLAREAGFDQLRRRFGLALGPAVFAGLLLAPLDLPPASASLAAVVGPLLGLL